MSYLIPAQMPELDNDDSDHKRNPKNHWHEIELPISPLPEGEWNVPSQREVSEKQHARTCEDARKHQSSRGAEVEQQPNEDPADQRPYDEHKTFELFRKSAA